MRLRYFLFSLAFLTGFVLLFAAFQEDPATWALKGLLMALGVSLLVAVIYPEIRGVKKGDPVRVSRAFLPDFLWPVGIALDDGRRNERIRVQLGGREIIGVITDYMGWISSPTVKVLYEEYER